MLHPEELHAAGRVGRHAGVYVGERGQLRQLAARRHRRRLAEHTTRHADDILGLDFFYKNIFIYVKTRQNNL